MKITHKKEPDFPYMAMRADIHLMVVTGKSDHPNYRRIIWITDNIGRPNFETGECPIDELEVFHGTITIEC